MTTLIHAPGCNTHCGGKCNPVDVSIVKGPVVLPVTEQHDEPVEVTQADAWRRLELWLFRECNEGTRRHLWSLFSLPLDEITDHGRERWALKYIKRCLATRPTRSSDMVEAMAAKDAEIARLSSDNEGLREMLRVVEDPDRQLCCSGHGCGCMGSTVGQYAAWAFRDTAAKDAQLAELRAEVERLRGALGWIATNYENGHINHVDFRVEAKHRADAALGSAE